MLATKAMAAEEKNYNTPIPEVGRVFEDWRLLRGLTRPDAVLYLLQGRVMEIDASTLARWEKGRHPMPIRAIFALEKFYGRPPGAVFVEAGLVREPSGSIEDAIDADRTLGPASKQVLRATLKSVRANPVG